MKYFAIALFLSFISFQCHRDKPIKNPESGFTDQMTMLRNFQVFLELEDWPIRDCHIIRDYNDSILLSNLVGDKHLVVIYISMNSCMNCVNELFNYIKKDSIAKCLDNIVVLACTPEFRMVYAFFKKYELDIPFYQIRASNALFEKNMDGPFVFTLNKSLTINHIIESAQQPEKIIKMYFESSLMLIFDLKC